jgi:hypothetical protein
MRKIIAVVLIIFLIATTSFVYAHSNGILSVNDSTAYVNQSNATTTNGNVTIANSTITLGSGDAIIGMPSQKSINSGNSSPIQTPASAQSLSPVASPTDTTRTVQNSNLLYENITNVPSVNVTVNLETKTIIPPQGYYLLINGTITNNNPNLAYNVGLSVSARGTPFWGSYNIILINMTLPINSATYAQYSDNTAAMIQSTADGSQTIVSSNFPLSTLAPNQSIPIEIRILPLCQSETATLRGINVTLVWS